MNNSIKNIVMNLSILALAPTVIAATSLDKKLDSLNIPSDKVTPLISRQELYSVNTRYSSLKNRHEFTMIGANNFTADDHLDTKQMGASYRYHLNAKVSFGIRATDYFNRLSGAGKKLFDNSQLLPDSDYSLKSSDAFINFNTVYGKVRLTQDTIVYFDQYIALGYGTINLSKNEAPLYIADIGISAWIGKHLSARFGVKNEFYRQAKLNGKDNVQNSMGYLELGYLFGSGSSI